MLREWIEILHGSMDERAEIGLPPCGGSGLKCGRGWRCRHVIWSPSMRREWIEILLAEGLISQCRSPSMRREWIEMTVARLLAFPQPSPSMRREWIEIIKYRCYFH